MITAIALGAASLGAGVYGANQAGKSQDAATRANQEATAATNAANERMFHESRGSSGSAILPEYFSGQEKLLGSDAAAFSRALMSWNGGPAGQLQSNQNILDAYRPNIAAGDKALTGIFDGTTAAARRASLAPVLAARTGLARSRSAAINQSLDETLANLRAGRAGSGFRGSSTFDTNRALAATTGARADAATALGQAGLDNASQSYGLDEQNLQLLLNSIDAPFSRAQQVASFNNLPVTSASAAYSNALSPLNFFRINPGSAPQQSPYLVQPSVNNGQIIGSAISAGAQSFGNYIAQQQLMKQMQGFYQPSYNISGYGAGGYGAGSMDMPFVSGTNASTMMG